MAITPHRRATSKAARFTDRLTKSAARNIFYGGSIFFFVVFAGAGGAPATTTSAP